MTKEENKAGFVAAVNDALIEYGDGRYDKALTEHPVTYTTNAYGREYIQRKDRKRDVTGNSLSAILEEIVNVLP